MADSLHGIATHDPTTHIRKFDGQRHLFPKWLNDLRILLNAKGITIPVSRNDPFMATNAFIYATTAAERVPIIVPTVNQVNSGLIAGDLPLTSTNLQMFLKARTSNERLKSLALGILWDHVLEGSAAYNRGISGFTQGSFQIIWFDFIQHYSSKITSAFLSLSMKSWKKQTLWEATSPNL